MHDHDEFLIIDLLDDPALTDAEIRARLDDCEECLAELETQRSIAAMLGSMPAPAMTDLERRSMRHGVERELDGGNVVTMPVRTMQSPARQTRRWDWTRLGTVAAALLGVFVIGGVVATLGTGGEDAADGDVTVAADLADDGAAEESAEMAAQEEDAPTDDAAADTDAGIAALAPRSAFVIDLGPVDAQTLAAEVDALGETIRTSPEASPLIEGALEGTGAECVSAIEDDAVLSGAIRAEVDGTPIIVYFDADGVPAAFSSPDCAPYELP